MAVDSDQLPFGKSLTKTRTALGTLIVKTARFSALVAASGRPSIHLAWAPPASDRTLQKALKEHRVLTVHQRSRGSKKDYAVIGLGIAHDAQYLVFPKSLRAFGERKIVGIQYELLSEGLSVGPTLSGRSAGKRESRPPKKAADVIPFPDKSSHPTASGETLSSKKGLATKVPKRTAPHLSPAVKKVILQALADLNEGLPSKAEIQLKSLLPD